MRHDIAADQVMKIQKKCVGKGGLCEFAVLDSQFQGQNVARDVRRELGVAQDPEARLDVSGSVSRRLSFVVSNSRSTASPSNAMLSATFNGIRPRRIRACSPAGARASALPLRELLHQRPIPGHAENRAIDC